MERKFIPTKDDQFTKFLANMQKVRDGFFTLDFEGRILNIEREIYLDGEYQILIDKIVEQANLILVKVVGDELDEYIPPKGFLEVTNMEVYEEENIAKGSIKLSNIIMEGTDGVGKSVSVEQLLRMGIVCQDRSIVVVSHNMFFHIPMEVRAREIEDYLINRDGYILFLVNNSKEELERRINSRDVISEYDLEAYRYNCLYLDTYNYMLEKNMLHDKLFLVDCTGLNIDEQVGKILEVINTSMIPSKDVKLRTLKQEK